MALELIAFSNPVFAGFAFYGTLVVLKMFALALLTSFTRGKRQVYGNEEDAKTFGSRKDAKVIYNDPGVERVRRNHLNDLENIPAFLFLGFLYVLTGPSLGAAIWHFRIFGVSRFLHTICYQVPLPQPSRALVFLVGMLANLSMAFQILRAAA